MRTLPSSWFPFGSLLAPETAFAELAAATPDPVRVLFKHVLWLAFAPAVFVFVGSAVFGWRLGAGEPLRLPRETLTLIALGYFIALLFGLTSAAGVSRWMAATYGGRDAFGAHLALVALAAAPLAIGSALHLFPHVFINVLGLIPALLWSLYLLYRGLPVVLHTGPERGVLMASALVGCLLVGAVTLLGVSVALWASGVGPAIGV